MRSSGSRWSLGASAMLGLVACGDDSIVSPAPPKIRPPLAATDPSAPGPYQVGVTTLEVESEGRALPVEVWYPAHPAAGAAAESYPLILGTAEIARLPSLLGAVRDAPLALEGAPHPTVVFSHGNRGWRAQSAQLMEVLASHGFVVAAPDHLGNAISGSFPTSIAESNRVRPTDVARTLDRVLEASDEEGGLLRFAVDVGRVGVAGHSFGATTALRVAGAKVDPSAVFAGCAQDPDAFLCDGWDASPLPPSQRDDRFRSVLAQSPLGTAVLGDAFGAIATPAMIQGGTHDQITPPDVECVPPYQALPSPAWLMLIEGAGHFSFSDICEFLDSVGAEIELLSDGCGDDDIASAEAHALAAADAAAFFRWTLSGDEAARAFLDPGRVRSPSVARFEMK